MLSPNASEACAICGVRVGLAPRGWRPGDTLYCPDHEFLAEVDPLVHGPQDLDRAIAEMSRPASDLLQWPWSSLRDLAGPCSPGTVTYVAAFPKNGKTTFLADLIYRWWNERRRIFIMPLEARTHELYTRLAALHLGMDPDFALSKRLLLAAEDGDPQARLERDLLIAEFRRWREDPNLLDGLWISPARAVTDAVLRRAMRQAHAANADVFIIDHVDHIGSADGESDVAVSFRAQMTALELAQELDLTVIAATQLNERATGRDEMARYRPPLMDWLWMPGKKQQVATTILGLFRPQRRNVTEEDKLLVRTGDLPMQHLLAPNRIGVSAMATRHGTGVANQVVQLRYAGGRIAELSDLDRHADAAERHGIETDNSPSLHRGPRRVASRSRTA